MTIASIGEILWDVFSDSEKLGGAPFNFAVHAHRLGHWVSFVSAVGGDARGEAARARAIDLGLDTAFLQTVPDAPTGTVLVRLDATGQPDFTIVRPAAYDRFRLNDEALAQLAALRPAWVYFGSLLQADAGARAETMRILGALPDAARFCDINLRRNCYTADLVSELLSLAHAVKLNEDEAAEVDAMSGRTSASLDEFTAHWSRKLGWRAVAVTRGASGCAIRIGGDYAESPGRRVAVADTVGAGDAFAAAFLHGLSQGWNAARTGDFANRLGAVVASRPGGVPPWTLDDCWSLS